MKLSPKAQAAMEKVVEKFKAGDLSPLTKVMVMNLPADAPARKWTFSNRVMAYATTGALDCRGYRQWTEVGRHVVKGASAGFIFFPKMVKDRETDEQKCVGFGCTAVFGYDDTDGDEVEDYQPRNLPPLMDVAERLEVDVKWMPLVGALGYCTSDNSKVRLATDDEAVFFHELAHAAHNTWEKKQTDGQDPHRETVAELTASILMDMHGLRDNTGNSWKYISHYNEEDPLRAILDAVKDVEKVLGIIFPEETKDA